MYSIRIYSLLLLCSLSIVCCQNDSYENKSEEFNPYKIAEDWKDENGLPYEITKESFVGEHDLSFFMYDGKLSMQSDGTFELREITDLSESIKFGTWSFSDDTAILISDSIRYSPKANVIPKTKLEAEIQLRDDGTVVYFPNNTEKNNTKNINDTTFLKLSEGKLSTFYY